MEPRPVHSGRVLPTPKLQLSLPTGGSRTLPTPALPTPLPAQEEGEAAQPNETRILALRSQWKDLDLQGSPAHISEGPANNIWRDHLKKEPALKAHDHAFMFSPWL